MSLFSRLQSAAQKRAVYRRTLAELNEMDNATANDLGVSPADFRRLAHEAAYGH